MPWHIGKRRAALVGDSSCRASQAKKKGARARP